MYKLCIIGSSDIIPKHIYAAQKNNFEIHSITSLNYNSLNAKKLKKKYKINKFYPDWKKCINESSQIKNICFLVAPKIEDSIRVLNYIAKYNKPTLVEKPISYDLKNFNKIKNKKNFVGYNRIFYKTVNYIKTEIKKQNFPKKVLVNVVCPETNAKTFVSNSCHIISILIYLFGKLNLKNKKANNKMISCNLENKKVHINLSIVFNAPSNFKIEIFSNKTYFNLAPIEELREYKMLKKIKKKNLNIYKPIMSKYIDDYNKSTKPGFYYQYKLFKSFCKNQKTNIHNSMAFAKNVISLCEKVVK
jgi:predicted dehydrogenase